MDRIQDQIDELVLGYQKEWLSALDNLENEVGERNDFSILDGRTNEIVDADPGQIVRHLYGEEVLDTRSESRELGYFHLQVLPGHGRDYRGHLSLEFEEYEPQKVKASFYLDDLDSQPTDKDRQKIFNNFGRVLDNAGIEYDFQ